MSKKIFTTLIVSTLLTTSTYAADNALKNFGNEIKETNKALLNKKVDSTTANQKAKINQYKDQQNQEHKKYQEAINAKKAELAEVKKNKSGMTQQQKEVRKAALQKQIDELNKKDAAMKESYNKKIEALKI